MDKIKCPCEMRTDMSVEDCRNTKCKDCCPATYTQTNADHIRSMSDEELAWELMTWRIETAAKIKGFESHYPNTKSTILEWLKQPTEGE